jgi:hypothetical protein
MRELEKGRHVTEKSTTCWTIDIESKEGCYQGGVIGSKSTV